MNYSCSRRFAYSLGAAIGALLVAIPGVGPGVGAQAASALPEAYIPHPISAAQAALFRAHPDAYLRYVAQLPRRSAIDSKAAAKRTTVAGGGTWTKVAQGPGGLCSPVLLTDGTVIASVGDTPKWFKLSPDVNGNYAKGTWAAIASLPVVNGKQYGPLYHATGVLPDGRVIIMGGEYNNSNHGVWTNSGAIYDPVANAWTPVEPPLGSQWQNIGDAASVVLSDGTFMLSACCAGPTADALLDAKTLGWDGIYGPVAGEGYQDEQGYELLPNTNVLTLDVWTNYPNGGATNAEQYVQGTRHWKSAGNTPVSLVDPAQCGNWEIGPAALRGDGTVVAFGGNTGCATAPFLTDPTAVYTAASNSWAAGPNVPSVCGGDGATPCSLADAPAALEPDGNVLFAASSGYGSAPTHFFEFTPGNTISQVSDTVLHAPTSGAYYYNFLVLPNGQILSTDFSDRAEVYSPAGAPVAAWAPAITYAPTEVTAGKTYQVKGTQLNGVSQGAYYGDDAQMATNYPIVRVTNVASGHVVYGRTWNMSSMSVTPGKSSSASFSVPVGVETGASTLSVVANGIASAPVSVTIR